MMIDGQQKEGPLCVSLYTNRQPLQKGVTLTPSGRSNKFSGRPGRRWQLHSLLLELITTQPTVSGVKSSESSERTRRR